MQPKSHERLLAHASQWLLALLIIVAAIGLAGSLCYILINGGMAGSKKELIFVALVSALPLLTYLAIRKPFVFPFSLYVIVAPFDTLLKLDPHFGTLTKLMALCAGAAFVFWLVRKRRALTPPPGTWWLVALLIWMALSVFWSLDPDMALSRLSTYAQLVTLYFVISIFPIEESDYSTFLNAAVVGGVVCAIYSVYLYHTGAFTQSTQTNGVLTSRLLVRFGGEKLGPDEFSAALLFPLAVVATWALQRAWSWKKFVYLIIALLIIVSIYINASRGALLAIGVMMLYMILGSRFRTQLMTVSIAALLMSFVMPNSPWGRFGNALSTGGAGRLSIWKVGWEAFKHRWLVGAGVGNFPVAYDRSFIRVFQSYYANWDRAPHNIVVEFAVELGIIGVILLLAAWYSQFRALGVINRSSSLFDVRIALEGALIGVFVAGLFVGLMSDKFTWVLFSVIAVVRNFALKLDRRGIAAVKLYQAPSDNDSFRARETARV